MAVLQFSMVCSTAGGTSCLAQVTGAHAFCVSKRSDIKQKQCTHAACGDAWKIKVLHMQWVRHGCSHFAGVSNTLQTKVSANSNLKKEACNMCSKSNGARPKRTSNTAMDAKLSSLKTNGSGIKACTM